MAAGERMRRIAVILAGCSAVLAGMSSRSGAQTRRALLIGINKYHYSAAVTDAWRGRLPPEAAAATRGPDTTRRADMPDLDGAISDARAMEQVLLTRFAFLPAHVRHLYNEQASREGILGAVRQLIRESQPGDVVVFYYAGHGSQRYNSLAPASASINKFDQTIVPADANIGQFDVRNTELTALFDELLARGALVTLIFDSCNSGSAVRGLVPLKVRFAPFDLRDARDSADPESLTRPGRPNPALVLAAAQETEFAWEDPGSGHGAFTAALLRVLQSAATSVNAPAQEIFRQVEANLRWNSVPQVPVLKGTGDDPSRPLFGAVKGPAAGRLMLTLQGITGPQQDTAILDGGAAMGIGDGTQLRLEGAGPPPLRLRVVDGSDLGTSRAVAIAGTLRPMPGAAFVVEKWVLPAEANLQAWVPTAIDARALSAASKQLALLRDSKSVEWVADPTALPDDSRPLYTVFYDGGSWKLRLPSGSLAALGGPSPSAVEAAVAADVRLTREAPGRGSGSHAGRSAATGTPRLFVMLPPTRTLIDDSELAGSGSPVRISASPAGCAYALVGRLTGDGGVSYAWVRPNATEQSAMRSPFPVRTDWIAGGDDAAGSKLGELGRRLARVNYWLTVQDHNPNPFPYHLVLRRTDASAPDKTADDTTATRGGERYELVLRRDPALPAQADTQWVYIFVIDRTGRGQLLFGQSMNKFPPQPGASAASGPSEVVVPRSGFAITAPYGIDTFVLLASAHPMGTPESTFTFPGVVLEAGSRGVQPVTDPPRADWSIQRLATRSAPPAGGSR